jgi:hypothetical protein
LNAPLAKRTRLTQFLPAQEPHISPRFHPTALSCQDLTDFDGFPPNFADWMAFRAIAMMRQFFAVHTGRLGCSTITQSFPVAAMQMANAASRI